MSAAGRIGSAELFTYEHPGVLNEAVEAAVAAAERAGVGLFASEHEIAKHPNTGLDPAPDDRDPGVCIVLGGDGTILRALRHFAGRGVPVFAVNFGRIGFLSAVDRDQLESGLDRALGGDFEVVALPGLVVAGEGEGATDAVALNDITVTRSPMGPMAELAYRLGDEEVGHVRCDGLVAATPQGSTGYNLANAGPIMAWGVEGYAVSFIAPHTLTARALVVAPDDVLLVRNVASRNAVTVAFDGAHEMDLPVGAEIEIGFRNAVTNLAQLPGQNFYHRLREKFGLLADPGARG
jgi:NAD+ kinase